MLSRQSACRYVLGKGHRNIALLVDNEDDVASKQMLEGYRSVLQNYSLPFNRQLLVMANNNIEQALLKLINSFTKYTAIIAKRDSYAAEAMRLLREFNIAVPQKSLSSALRFPACRVALSSADLHRLPCRSIAGTMYTTYSVID
jgi:DNA-binding LacI/PurR family transcriptional regulator